MSGYVIYHHLNASYPFPTRPGPTSFPLPEAEAKIIHSATNFIVALPDMGCKEDTLVNIYAGIELSSRGIKVVEVPYALGPDDAPYRHVAAYMHIKPPQASLPAGWEIGSFEDLALLITETEAQGCAFMQARGAPPPMGLPVLGEWRDFFLAPGHNLTDIYSRMHDILTRYTPHFPAPNPRYQQIANLLMSQKLFAENKAAQAPVQVIAGPEAADVEMEEENQDAVDEQHHEDYAEDDEEEQDHEGDEEDDEEAYFNDGQQA